MQFHTESIHLRPCMQPLGVHISLRSVSDLKYNSRATPYLSLEEQSIWASRTHAFPSSELPACPGGHTEGWSAVDARSGSPSEEPSVHTAALDTSTENHL